MSISPLVTYNLSGILFTELQKLTNLGAPGVVDVDGRAAALLGRVLEGLDPTGGALTLLVDNPPKKNKQHSLDEVNRWLATKDEQKQNVLI